MKKLKKLFTFACLCGLGYVCSQLLRRDDVQDKLFDVMGEDRYIAANNLVHLLGDLLMWPVDFVRALLP